MKKIRKNIKMIIGIIIGVIISVTTSYVLAATLINSKDVVYQDNMSIGATNVQNAIDGTCSKIDTRLSAIEDKLYTVSNLSKSRIFFESTTSLIYTGISIPIPAKSYCTVTVTVTYSNSPPLRIAITSNSSSNAGYNTLSESFADNDIGSSIGLSTTYSAYNEVATTYYVFAQYKWDGQNPIAYYGFCATKVK